jgi:hypothetical protein
MSMDMIFAAWIGFVIGTLIGGFLALRQFRQGLELSSLCNTAQKINDSFYYIVPESRYVQMTIDSLKAFGKGK